MIKKSIFLFTTLVFEDVKTQPYLQSKHFAHLSGGEKIRQAGKAHKIPRKKITDASAPTTTALQRCTGLVAY